MTCKEELKHDILHSTLSPDNTFQFSCKGCGECCRNRTTPVMLTGLDIYRMAGGLHTHPYEMLSRYTTGHLGSTTHIPVVVLRERLDEWGLKELDTPSLAWNLMIGKVAEVMHKFDPISISRDMVWELYQRMYGEYDTNREFIPQVEENSEALQKYFKDKLNIEI